MDPLADALINIKNCEIRGKESCTIRPASKLIGNILMIMQKSEYIGNFELIDDGKAGVYKVELKGKIHECKAIKPRYSVRKDEFTKWEKRYLPAKDIGLLVLSTPKGVMTHKAAKQLKTGGKLIAFVY